MYCHFGVLYTTERWGLFTVWQLLHLQLGLALRKRDAGSE
jgi:hypothetical protein